MEIQPAEMEEGRVLEALGVPVPARHPLDPHERLKTSSFSVLLDQPRERLVRQHHAAACEAQPWADPVAYQQSR